MSIFSCASTATKDITQRYNNSETDVNMLSTLGSLNTLDTTILGMVIMMQNRNILSKYLIYSAGRIALTIQKRIHRKTVTKFTTGMKRRIFCTLIDILYTPLHYIDHTNFIHSK